MRNREEIVELKAELDRLTDFIGEFGTQEEFEDKDVGYACNVCDALSWVLGEIRSEDFRSDANLNMDNLEAIAESIEKRSGRRLEDYE